MIGFFLFVTMSRLALWATQPPVLWVLGALILGVKLTAHLYLVPRLRMPGTVPPQPQYVFMIWHLIK